LLGRKQVYFYFKYINSLNFFSYGQIGDGTPINRFFPVAVDTFGVLLGKKITQISSGFGHSCVIANDSNSYCWGLNK
jgi:alpha-tubulin suppressor-like RCC1 family protein